ncbi:UbiX family flavin prenyltransferase, partial [Kingella kingae]|nr:UbiX family flavin prenyltransferase [Kingella kingae]
DVYKRQLSQLGCTILPPAAGFYHQPKTVEDMVDFVVARILDQLRLPHQLMPKWGQ